MGGWKVTLTAAAAPAATVLLDKLARFDGLAVESANTDTQTTFVLEAPSAKRACRAALVIFERAAPKAEIRAIMIERLS